MNVRDVMSHRVITIGEDVPLEQARETMQWGGIRHLPVVKNGRVVGILSERDVFARLALASTSQHRGRAQTVANAMQVPVETASPEELLADVSVRMAGRKLGCLPVLENGALVGILTTTDALSGLGTREGPHDTRENATVGSVMSPSPSFARTSEALADAASRMANHRVRHLPVVDAKDVVVGILSDRDVLAVVGDPHGLFSKAKWPAAAEELSVLAVMTPLPFAVRSSDRLTAAVRILIDRRIGAVPVVDAAGHLQGILSYVDVLTWFARDAEEHTPPVPLRTTTAHDSKVV